MAFFCMDVIFTCIRMVDVCFSFIHLEFFFFYPFGNSLIYFVKCREEGEELTMICDKCIS